MKTAKEVVDKILDENSNGLTANPEFMDFLVKSYAKQACKEQREICAKKAELGRTGIGISLDSITNAPEPNLE